MAAPFNITTAKKYVLDFSYRLDGSSTNGPNQPFVKVPAVGLRWNFNNEKFMERLDWVDYSSVRASWGKNIVPTGSIFDAYGRYVTSGQYNNNPATGLNWEYLPNVGLLPRITTQLSYALEAGFLNGKFSTVLESYYKQLDNELFNISIADHNGFAKFKTNYMSHVNYGYEFTVTYRPFNKEKFRWNISANGAFNHDILTRLPNDVRQILHKDESTVGASGRIYYTGSAGILFRIYCTITGVYFRMMHQCLLTRLLVCLIIRWMEMAIKFSLKAVILIGRILTETIYWTNVIWLLRVMLFPSLPAVCNRCSPMDPLRLP